MLFGVWFSFLSFSLFRRLDWKLINGWCKYPSRGWPMWRFILKWTIGSSSAGESDKLSYKINGSFNFVHSGITSMFNLLVRVVNDCCTLYLLSETHIHPKSFFCGISRGPRLEYWRIIKRILIQSFNNPTFIFTIIFLP